MKNKKVVTFFFLFLLQPLFLFPTLAYWVWSPETGKFVNPEGAVQDSAQEQFEYAMQLYKERDLDGAKEQFRNLLKKYPGSRVAPEAQYRLGTIYEEEKEYRKAFHAYKTLVESYPQSERVDEVIEREYRIANLFLSGRKGKILGMAILPSLPRAAEIFKHIVTQAPYSEWGDKAQFRLGLTYKKEGRFEEAMEAFQALIDQYPQSELVADARFQLAETAYLRSQAEFRDQRALESASEVVDQFLTRYPDATVSDKVAKLRQEIDEKNAEKNYRIALYYERENYLPSALIYYADVAHHYAHTKWGKKAQDRLKMLKEPATYLSAQDEELRQEISVVRAKLQGLTEADAIERERLERQLERLEKREKALQKMKKESLERRDEDLQRRQSELKEKFKRLENKAKLLKDNPSEDLKRAIERWRASLEEERDQLEREKQKLQEWRRSLGVGEGFSWGFLPFIGETKSPVEKVRRIEAKELYEVANRKKLLLSEKEVLYKQYNELATTLQVLERRKLGLGHEQMSAETASKIGGEELALRYRKLDSLQRQIAVLETELKEAQKAYEEQYGTSFWSSWLASSGNALQSSVGTIASSVEKSLGWLPSLSGKREDLENQSLQQLLEKRMHLREKIATQQTLIHSLEQAFNEELAIEEQRRLMDTLETSGQVDVNDLRRSIKQIEKDVRSRYQEIQDRHKHKKELIEALDRLLKGEAREAGGLQKTARIATAPVRGFARFWKAFLFGLPDRDAALTRAVESVNTDPRTKTAAKRLKEEIEIESLLIEAKSREIRHLERELEILKARASLAGGLKFRSAFVTVPYEIVGEAIDKAKRLIPRKERDEVLIQGLDKETKELEALKAELRMIEVAIAQKDTSVSKRAEEEQVPIEKKALTTQKAVSPSAREATRTELEAKIKSLAKELELRRKEYEKERALLHTQLAALSREAKGVQGDYQQKIEHIAEREAKLNEELEEIKASLKKVIEREKELEKSETEILVKRINKIDELLKKVTSKAISQDLLTERERLEQRISQVEGRANFLTNELQRIHPTETSGVRQ